MDLLIDKDFHLFVCFENKTLDTVRIIVDKLEENGLRCCYSDRDFTYGRSIMENINHGITKSMNMLVVLSEDFRNSRYCMHELDTALNLKIKGEYNLIPLKVQPCEVPECIQHLTYIDAEEDIETVHLKITDAIVRKEIFTDHEDVLNGLYETFTISGSKTSRLALPRYKLHFTETDMARIRNSGIEISAELLHEIEDTVNTSFLIRYLHILDNIYSIISAVCFVGILVVLILFLVLLVTTSGKQMTKCCQPADYVLIIGLPVITLAWLLSAIILCCLSEKSYRGLSQIYKRAVSVLKNQVWRLSKKNLEQTGAIFFIVKDDTYIESFSDTISLHIMRYNFKTCKAYFASRMKSNKRFQLYITTFGSKEIATDIIFNMCLHLNAYHIEQERTTTRHKTANGGHCACLVVEHTFT